MRAEHLMGVVGALVLLMGWGNVSPARSELRAVVEDSTTIVVMRGDSVVFRKEMEFAREVSSYTQTRELGYGTIAVICSYAPSDTVLVNPLPGIRERGPSRGHLLLVGADGGLRLSADANWCGLHPGCLAMISPDTLMILYADVGELVRVDLQTGEVTSYAISDWGCPCYCDEPCPGGSVAALGKEQVFVVRSDLHFCGTGVRSEVLVADTRGQVVWRMEGVGFVVESRVLDLANHRAFIVRRYAPTGRSERYEILALDEGGQILWETDLGPVAVRRVELRGESLEVIVHPLPGLETGGHLFLGPLMFEAQTGKREGEAQ